LTTTSSSSSSSSSSEIIYIYVLVVCVATRWNRFANPSGPYRNSEHSCAYSNYLILPTYYITLYRRYVEGTKYPSASLHTTDVRITGPGSFSSDRNADSRSTIRRYFGARHQSCNDRLDHRPLDH
jgi:hypothetical protein